MLLGLHVLLERTRGAEPLLIECRVVGVIVPLLMLQQRAHEQQEPASGVAAAPPPPAAIPPAPSSAAPRKTKSCKVGDMLFDERVLLAKLKGATLPSPSMNSSAWRAHKARLLSALVRRWTVASASTTRRAPSQSGRLGQRTPLRRHTRGPCHEEVLALRTRPHRQGAGDAAMCAPSGFGLFLPSPAASGRPHWGAASTDAFQPLDDASVRRRGPPSSSGLMHSTAHLASGRGDAADHYPEAEDAGRTPEARRDAATAGAGRPCRRSSSQGPDASPPPLTRHERQVALSSSDPGFCRTRLARAGQDRLQPHACRGRSSRPGHQLLASFFVACHRLQPSKLAAPKVRPERHHDARAPAACSTGAGSAAS